MITFQGRQKAIRTADIIQRKAHSLYPHISSSKLEVRYNNSLHFSNPSYKLTPDLCQNVIDRLRDMRIILREGNNYLTKIISELQDKKVGNCFEDAILSLLIGKLNGQKNTYIGSIIFQDKKDKTKIYIDHVVSFVTRKKIKFKNIYTFKNKDAVIIDPWLNIVDFADNYFTRIMNNYMDMFKGSPEKDFKELKKKSSKQFSFCIDSNVAAELDKKDIEYFKALYPELVIKKYKKITFPRKKKS